MFTYFFDQFEKAGKYAIAYIYGKNEYRTEVELEAKDKEELKDKWRLFAAANGLSVMSIVGLDRI